MNDSTQFLTTLAQLGGGFVAIIGGFIFSSALNAEKQIKILRKQYDFLSAQMLREHAARGITAYDIYKGHRKNEVDELYEPVRNLIDEMSGARNTYVVRKALLSIIPMVLFGIFIPLIFLAANITELTEAGKIVLVTGFLFSVSSILGFIAWYVWFVHAN